MAPQKPRPASKSKSRPSSGEDGRERSPRKSDDKRTTRSPEKRKSHQSGRRNSESLEKRPLKRAAGEDESHRGSSQSSTNVLSVDSLAKLDALNEKDSYANKEKDRKERAKKEKIIAAGRVNKEKVKSRKETGGMTRRRRNITGELEEGRGTRGGLYDAAHTGQKKKRCWLLLACFAVLLLVILIPVGVLVIGKQNSNSSDPTPTSSTPANGSLSSIDPSDIPTSAKGGPLDPFTWYDTQDFNITYTDETVGGLFVMGLNSTWDDSIRANQYVPPLNETFKYGTMPIRGVNLGGWLSLEPFITPSMFNTYDPKFGIVDEWTLTSHLGPSQAAQTLEKHYSTFINKQSFADIQAAGFDHVRIPYSYWAVTTYDGDPYVPKISWRYLLRAIEYARMFGIRVNLDLHGLPGSQNGWNHSGRQGAIGWLNGTDGSLNAQRALDIHGQLSTFFAQPRYANVVGIYGLVNEPKMISLPTQPVLDWTTSAVSIIRKNGLTQTIAFGDGFLGLPNWKGKLSGLPGLVLDAHNYVIFNVNQIAFNHQSKLNFACSGWAGQMSMSINTATGYGPTFCGEWSQADTDCATYLNNVGIGSRWEGTLNFNDPSLNVLTPSCPPNSGTCECMDANADPSNYSDLYKRWLLMNAEAQMTSFEIGWGWFYWTWLTESSPQWSWKLGMESGILPQKVWDRDFNCTVTAPTFSGLPENY